MKTLLELLKGQHLVTIVIHDTEHSRDALDSAGTSRKALGTQLL